MIRSSSRAVRTRGLSASRRCWARAAPGLPPGTTPLQLPLETTELEYLRQSSHTKASSATCRLVVIEQLNRQTVFGTLVEDGQARVVTGGRGAYSHLCHPSVTSLVRAVLLVNHRAKALGQELFVESTKFVVVSSAFDALRRCCDGRPLQYPSMENERPSLTGGLP